LSLACDVTRNQCCDYSSTCYSSGCCGSGTLCTSTSAGPYCCPLSGTGTGVCAGSGSSNANVSPPIHQEDGKGEGKLKLTCCNSPVKILIMGFARITTGVAPLAKPATSTRQTRYGAELEQEMVRDLHRHPPRTAFPALSVRATITARELQPHQRMCRVIALALHLARIRVLARQMGLLKSLRHLRSI
jgi:hypothetical protein